MRRHVAVFSAASVALLAALLLAAWASLGFDASGMSVHGWIAMVLGAVLTCGLAVALMAAVFASDRGGYDSGAGGRAQEECVMPGRRLRHSGMPRRTAPASRTRRPAR